MKEFKVITAIVKPFKVDRILDKLIEAGYPNITVSLAEGTGTYSDDTVEDPFVSTCFSLTNVEVAKIEIICNDSDVAKIIEIISSNGRTGNAGDGIIYVLDVTNAFRVKTGTNV